MGTVAYLIGEHDLHAYVDNCLSAGRRKAVEAYIAQHEEAAALVEHYRAQNAALRQLIGSDEPLPASIEILCSILATSLVHPRHAWNKSAGKRVSLSPRF